MNPDEPQPEKLYYSISEVAKRFGISIEVLRKWESDFPRYLKPHRTLGATRRYTAEDITRVETVYRLLKVERLTIAGAKKKLAERASKEERLQEAIITLRSIRADLMSIVQEMGRQA
jgi:DNA-binding transcriptional MerR regulator